MGYTNYFEPSRAFTDDEWNYFTLYAERLFDIALDPLKHGINDVRACVFIAGEDGVTRTTPTIDHDEVAFNGQDNDAHESCFVSRNGTSDYCKTERKPYDPYVVALYLLAREALCHCAEVRSDGEDEEGWDDFPRLLVNTALEGASKPEEPEATSHKPKPFRFADLHASR